MMKVTVEELTDIKLTRKLLEKAYGIPESKMDKALLYKRKHSIQRSILFHITLEDIPTFVSVHLVRHAGVGQFHLVSSNRDDWNDGLAPESVHRLTPVTHQMILNAAHLRTIAEERLCGASHKETVEVMTMIREAVREVDPDLAKWMVPKCFHTNYCSEHKSCGRINLSEPWRVWRDAL